MSSLTSSYAGALILASMAALGAAYLGNKVSGESLPSVPELPAGPPEPAAPPAPLEPPATGTLALLDGAPPPGPPPPDSSVSEEDARRKLLPLVRADGVDAILKFVKTPASQWKTVAPSTFKLAALVAKSSTHPDKCPAAMIRICALIFAKYSQMAKASKGEAYDEVGNDWAAFADLIDELPEPPAEAPAVPEPPAAPAAPAVPEPPTADPPRFPSAATLDRPWLSGVPSTHGPAVQEGPLIGQAPVLETAAVPPPQSAAPPTPPAITRPDTEGPPSPAGPDRPWLQPLDARVRGPLEVVPPPQLKSRLNIDEFKLPEDVYEDTPPPPEVPPPASIARTDRDMKSLLANSGKASLVPLPASPSKDSEVRSARPTIGELTDANAEAKATELAEYIKANPLQRASIINEFTSALESAMHAGRVSAATRSAVRTLVGASRRRREG